MQFPNPIVRSLILYDTSGNAVIILGPGPFIKIINPTTGAELDLDAGTSFPEAVFWNSAHTFFGKISLEVSTFSTRQMMLFTSPPDQTFAIPGTPDVQPRLFLTSAIQLGDVLPVGSNNGIGGQLYLDEAALALSLNDSANPSTAYCYIQAVRGDPAVNKADLYMASNKPSVNSAFRPRVQYDTGYIVSESAWNAFVYQNGWTNLGGAWRSGGYRIGPDGRVWFKGVIIGGTKADGTVMWNMPANYRPPGDVILDFAIISGGSAANVSLRVFAGTGDVQCFGINATVNGNMSLETTSYSLLP